MHPLLQRQLTRAGLSADAAPENADAWRDLLTWVGRAYTEADQDRYLLERSLAISSKEMRGLHAQLAAERDTLRTVILSLTEGVCVLDADHRVLLINPEAERILGVSGPVALGQPFDQVAILYDEHGQGLRQVVGNSATGGESRVLIAGDRSTYVVCTATPLAKSGGGLVLTLRDITAQKQAEQELWRGAFNDRLTGLPNRALLRESLSKIMEEADRGGGGYAVLFLDLDRFKLVNDSLGHLAGDQLLLAFAERLTAALPAIRGDHRITLGRLGGDEFVILVERISEVSEARRIASRVLALLAEPFRVGSGEVYCNASIGITLGPGAYRTPDDVLRDADVAMYHAKSSGKGCFAVFDASMTERAVTRLKLETDLRRALERGEVSLNFQPIVALGDGGILGLEALLRWTRADGAVDPAKFIPVAEETGLIVPLGRWALEQACRAMVDWRRRVPALRGAYVSVNLSRKQFALSDIIADVRGVLERTGLDPGALVLEVTESTMMDDLASASSTIDRLRTLGVGVQMDDFGTGYSSLSFLKRLPINGVKIDRSFVAQMESSRANSAIIHAIVTLARNLRMSVTAEGIETADQLAATLALDCDGAQGFHFARPMPACDVPDWCAAFCDQLSAA